MYEIRIIKDDEEFILFAKDEKSLDFLDVILPKDCSTTYWSTIWRKERLALDVELEARRVEFNEDILEYEALQEKTGFQSFANRQNHLGYRMTFLGWQKVGEIPGRTGPPCPHPSETPAEIRFITNHETGEDFYIKVDTAEGDSLVSQSTGKSLSLPEAAIVMLQLGSEAIGGTQHLRDYLKEKGIEID